MEMINYIYCTLCFILPNTIWQLINKNKIKEKTDWHIHIILTYVFLIYCGLAMYVAGIGTIWDIISYQEIIGGINVLPFSSGGALTYILNVVMFMPLGFLLPLIWKHFQKIWKVILFGLVFSVLIETMQLFCHRLSDVDDLLMNTFGACIGYWLWIVFNRIFCKTAKKTTEITSKEPWIYILLGSMGIFVLFNWRILS